MCHCFRSNVLMIMIIMIIIIVAVMIEMMDHNIVVVVREVMINDINVSDITLDTDYPD